MPDSFLLWDPAQVSFYLGAEVGADISSTFIENNIDGSLLPFLTTEHLRELGILALSARLRVKRLINDLISSQFAQTLPASMADPEYRLNAVNINSNFVSMEALTLCLVLLHEMHKATEPQPDESLDIRRLNDNFKKLKTDLNPVIRLMKETKPLPTPTLDPGIPAALPTYSLNSIYSTNSWLTSEHDSNQASGATLTPATVTTPGSTTAPGLGLVPNASPKYPPLGAIPKSTSNSSIQRQSVSSPTHSHRFSSGSVLSMGVGKVAEVKTTAQLRFLAKPRLIDPRPSPTPSDHEEAEHPGLKQQGSSQSVHTLKTKPSLNTVASSAGSVFQQQQGTQPLKQLKASKEDTCLKVLQQAMKRHHIPREKWSKYVLVICYGDKERILKLTEKPVVVFKELMEHGKNPAIMLRELAGSQSETANNYEDSRISDDIPGGTL